MSCATDLFFLNTKALYGNTMSQLIYVMHEESQMPETLLNLI